MLYVNLISTHAYSMSRPSPSLIISHDDIHVDDESDDHADDDVIAFSHELNLNDERVFGDGASLAGAYTRRTSAHGRASSKKFCG